MSTRSLLRRALRAAEGPRTPPPGATYILTAATELSALERAFLERIAGGSLVTLAPDPAGAWKRLALTAALSRALGEENEIREVFRAILSGGIPFDDVEILHTDSVVYPPLFWELLPEHAIPFTLAGGIPVFYTRPGQAALAFLDWIGGGFAAEEPRQGSPPGRSPCRAWRERERRPRRGRRAPCARRAWAGGASGTSPASSGSSRILEKPDDRSHPPGATDEQRASREEERRSRNLEGARLVMDFIRRALSLAPQSLTEGPGDLRSLAGAARTFLADFARAADESDGTARTALDALFAEFADLPTLRLTTAAAVARLRDAVARLAIASDRPRPGRVHAAHYRAGGFSGRRHTFLVGLDEARLPGRDLEDPVLLDEERRRINESARTALLALGRERPREASAAFWACLGRLRGSLSASYTSFDLRSLVQAGEPAPSPASSISSWQRSGNSAADYSDLAEALPRAAGFAPAPHAALDDTEWWLLRLHADISRAAREEGLAAVVRSVYPWLEDGRRAEAARASDDFTIWDGFVRSGTPEPDPRSGGEPFSPSRVEKLASCPFSYFVKTRAPRGAAGRRRERSDPMALPDGGRSLLHEVFRSSSRRSRRPGRSRRRQGTSARSSRSPSAASGHGANALRRAASLPSIGSARTSAPPAGLSSSARKSTAARRRRATSSAVWP